jgi:hypothetical protein
MIKIFIYTYFNTFLEIINNSLNSLWLCISFLILLFIGIYFSSGAKKTIIDIIEIGKKVAKAVITGVAVGASKSLADKHMSDDNDKDKDKEKNKNKENKDPKETENQDNKKNTSDKTK